MSVSIFILLVEPEGPWCLQWNASAFMFRDRIDGLIGQYYRCFQQVRRSTLLCFTFRRGHVRKDSAAASQRQNHVTAPYNRQLVATVFEKRR